MSREIINRIEFTTICLSDFAQKHSLALPEAYQYLKNFGGIDYLKDCYDAAHLQSIEDNILDLTTLCHRNGGYLR